MMSRILRRVWKKTRDKSGWPMTLAACTCFILLAVGHAGAVSTETTGDGALGGKAWCDLNEDGKRQNGEPLLSDVLVTLKQVSANGQYHYVASTHTNANGRYKFKNLPLGKYAVLFDANDLSFTTPNVGNDRRDSDVTGEYGGGGITDPVDLDANDPTNYRTDAGYVGCDTPEPPKDGAIGGVTWCDENGDGLRQANELILPGVCVKLKKLVNGQYEVVAETTTDAQGRYKFEELAMGTYVVAWCDNNLDFTVADQGDDCKDSDVIDQSGNLGLSAQIVLNADQPTSLCTDAGYVGDCGPPSPEAACEIVASTGTTFDIAYENIAPDSTLLRNGEEIDTISGTGSFSDSPGGPDGSEYEYTIESDGQVIALCGTVTIVNPPQVLGSIGDRVWIDANANGIQDTGEEGVEGVTVNLMDAGGSVIETTATDANGNYLFDELDAGDYSVGFVEPDGFDFTTANEGANDNVDSDADVDTGMTGIISLGEGEHRRDVDAGLVKVTECIELYFHGALNGDGDGKGTISYYPYYKSLRIGLLWLGSLFPDGTKLVDIDYAPLNQLINDVFQVGVPNGPSRIIGSDFPTSSGGSPKVFAAYAYYDLHLSRSDYDLLDTFANELSHLELNVTMQVDGHLTEIKLCASAVPEVDTSISPIALDTDGSGTVERIRGEFAFDFAANGKRVKASQWFAPTEGILVDMRKQGPMTGAHLFGDMGGRYADGYAKLATLDANADGAVSGAELTGLAIWTDANSNAMADEGEISALAAHRIVSLSTRHTGYVSTVTLGDGTTMMAEDLWFPMVLPPPVAKPLATPMSIYALFFGLSCCILLALLIMAVRSSRRISLPEAV